MLPVFDLIYDIIPNGMSRVGSSCYGITRRNVLPVVPFVPLEMLSICWRPAVTFYVVILPINSTSYVGVLYLYNTYRQELTVYLLTLIPDYRLNAEQFISIILFIDYL